MWGLWQWGLPTGESALPCSQEFGCSLDRVITLKARLAFARSDSEQLRPRAHRAISTIWPGIQAASASASLQLPNHRTSREVSPREREGVRPLSRSLARDRHKTARSAHGEGGTAQRLVARVVPHFRLGELISPPCTGRYEVLSLALGCQAYTERWRRSRAPRRSRRLVGLKVEERNEGLHCERQGCRSAQPVPVLGGQVTSSSQVLSVR